MIINHKETDVSGIETSSVNYSYVNDETIVNSLGTNTTIQVGYYKLAQLETQKADLTNLWSNVYPVGSIYTSVNSTNPSTFFGGTWERFGKGKTLIGVDENDTNFNTVEKTGGEKTHTLTVNEMPSHSHTCNYHGFNNSQSRVHSFISDSTEHEYSYGTLSDIINSTGGSQAHNNLQPYITVYMWKRVA